MNAARSAPVLDILAANDNAVDDEGVLSASPRARTALSTPLRQRDAVPSAACRRHHDIAGERAFSSIVCVEQFDGAPRWRVSVAIQGRPDDDRREVALSLARHLVGDVGAGALQVDQGPSVVIIRRALTPRERTVLARSRLAVAIQP